MATAALKPQDAQRAALADFLADLTELSRKHGIGIAGAPELYIVEPEEKLFEYTCDAESRLTLR